MTQGFFFCDSFLKIFFLSLWHLWFELLLCDGLFAFWKLNHQLATSSLPNKYVSAVKSLLGVVVAFCAWSLKAKWLSRLSCNIKAVPINDLMTLMYVHVILWFCHGHPVNGDCSLKCRDFYPVFFKLTNLKCSYTLFNGILYFYWSWQHIGMITRPASCSSSVEKWFSSRLCALCRTQLLVAILPTWECPIMNWNLIAIRSLSIG